MTSPAPTAGALQIAAALVFHLPGARLELSTSNHAGRRPRRRTDSDPPAPPPCGDNVDHLGGGLYRVAGCETTSYAFTTPLPARRVDTLVSDLESTAIGCCADAAGDHDGGLTVCVNLVQDDGLGVTLVAMSSPGASNPDCVEAVAAAAAAKCLVAEMEQLTTSRSSPG